MDFKEFFEKYLDEDITTISDLVIDVFNKKLPDDILDEYDLGEILTEFTGHHETAKKFDKIEAFGKVIKNKQPELYSKEGGYINEALIKYFCFLKDEQKLQEQTNDAISRDYDYDLLLHSFKQLLYNQHIEQVNLIIEKEYDNVKKSPKLIEGAEFDLAIVKLYIELEHLFLAQKDASNIDFNQFKNKTNQYGFNFDNIYFQHLKIGLFDNSLDKINDLLKEFPKDRSYVMTALGMRFLKFMQLKDCPFPVGGMIWYNLFQYFEEKRVNNWKKYFSFKASSFKEFVSSKSGFFSDYRVDEALIIWGSSYLLDFVYENKIISEMQYLGQKEILSEVKDEFKEKNKYDLWEYNFIHKWQPDETTNPELWNDEKDEFENSYDLEVNYDDFKHFNLDNLLGEPIIPKRNTPKNNIPTYESKPRPKIDSKKIGRNEKINVKYKDGTIVKEVKYKKVIKDIENGDCEII